MLFHIFCSSIHLARPSLTFFKLSKNKQIKGYSLQGWVEKILTLPGPILFSRGQYFISHDHIWSKESHREDKWQGCCFLHLFFQVESSSCNLMFWSFWRKFAKPFLISIFLTIIFVYSHPFFFLLMFLVSM